MSISTKNQRSGLKIPFPLRELSILTFGATVIGLLVYQNVSLSADLLGPMTYGIRGDCPPSSSFEISETSTTTAEDKYAMALEESLGFFDNIPQDDWEVMRNITLRRVNNERKSNPLFDSHRPEAWYQKNWDPDFSCRHDTKVGMGDGGKVRTSNTKHFFLPARRQVETICGSHPEANHFLLFADQTQTHYFSPCGLVAHSLSLRTSSGYAILSV